MPDAAPALVVIGPSVTKSVSSTTRARGNRRASSPIRFQWVVQRRPSSMAASPKANAPVHTPQKSAPDAAFLRSHVLSSRGDFDCRMSNPGTTTKSPSPTLGNAVKREKPSVCAVPTSRDVPATTMR
jgi:hypothetical protein